MIYLESTDKSMDDCPIWRIRITSPPEEVVLNVHSKTVDNRHIEVESYNIQHFDIGQRYTCPAWVALVLDRTLSEMGYEYIGKVSPDSHKEKWKVAPNAQTQRTITRSNALNTSRK